MCDYCGCRSRPQIAVLSADHDTLLELVDELRVSIAADDRPHARFVLWRVHDLLHDHAGREERGVFAQLRREVRDPAYVPMFEHDHEVLHGLLDACAGDDWQRPARDLIVVLREHILREETDLFPAAHQMLEPEHWSAVDAAVLDLVDSGGGR